MNDDLEPQIGDLVWWNSRSFDERRLRLEDLGIIIEVDKEAKVALVRWPFVNENSFINSSLIDRYYEYERVKEFAQNAKDILTYEFLP